MLNKILDIFKKKRHKHPDEIINTIKINALLEILEEKGIIDKNDHDDKVVHKIYKLIS